MDGAQELERTFDRLVPAVYWLSAFLLLMSLVAAVQGRWHWAMLPVVLVQPAAVWLAARGRREIRLGLCLTAVGMTVGVMALGALLFAVG